MPQETNAEKTPEELEKRRRWFEGYVGALRHNSIVKPPIEGIRYVCPCCLNKTLSERGGFNVCPVCFWEDDGQDDEDADLIRGGPNGSISLAHARASYKQFGACDERFIEKVRKPLADEVPDRNIEDMRAALQGIDTIIDRDD